MHDCISALTWCIVQELDMLMQACNSWGLRDDLMHQIADQMRITNV